MEINIQSMEDYLSYQGKKYIAPEKAGERKIEMETFKKEGQLARKEFQELSKAVHARLSDFNMQKVSGWMNQAQIGRPHFWCYFKTETETRADSCFAIRLLTIEERLGISVEVSFIERGVIPETIVRQNQVLEVPISEPLYYLVQENGESQREAGTEDIREKLKSKVLDGSVRKVLVKYDIPKISEFETNEELIEEIINGFKMLDPYRLATRKEGKSDL
ncbi:HI_0552 family protein [Jeotgalibaca ciconiae]|uniref:Ribonuclease P n=1 Tax=Jeotgalibaca ciconiae TaxID=2496265 RepID=A0A3Q9BJS4_9LACT|nr:HI_0552 family protein [Jeotgalibaca ciconiae]AZP03965.1 ribonuclease P [Jeotgalibaca ciconiae]HJB23455.1 ribonuclease P [Candidatus Jeotgalibaca pullicola]